VVGADARTDVAVLQIEAGGPFPWLPLGDSSEVRVGDMVLAVGNPFEFQSTVTLGIISATGRRGLGEREIQDYLQTDAAVNPGSSGGPLLDLDGRVIGINTAIFAPEVDQNAGISFAVPSNLVKRVVEDLEAGAGVPRSWVGLVTRSVATVDGDATWRGAEVLRVVPDSPAERSGIRRGDILVSVDGEATPSSEALRTLVLAREVGSRLALVATRDGRPVDLEVTTRDEREQWVGLQDLPRDAVYWAGLFLAPPVDELRARFGVGAERGLIVARVDPDSDAARLGLEPGDLVTEVGGTAVTDPEALRELLSMTPRGVLVVAVRRSGSPLWAVLPTR
jgi:S1-C subfamily serine protease